MAKVFQHINFVFVGAGFRENIIYFFNMGKYIKSLVLLVV